MSRQPEPTVSTGPHTSQAPITTIPNPKPVAPRFARPLCAASVSAPPLSTYRIPNILIKTYTPTTVRGWRGFRSCFKILAAWMISYSALQFVLCFAKRRGQPVRPNPYFHLTQARHLSPRTCTLDTDCLCLFGGGARVSQGGVLVRKECRIVESEGS